MRNSIVITAAGALEWNGQTVTQPQLRHLLTVSTQLPEVPELHLRPDAAAPYRVVDEVLVLTKRANVQKLSFVGNEAYARF
ncbi:MAG: hypothetical protein AVDCRST_MAG62-1813 [uncultured Sphingomonas sp.]|uniref:Uncharacterized protein n=1 Tax=uncultured Sphingomonas sp. TaxID=158754 RepID=A0A6J4TS45_9SPHN|nr:MAG: hypothetical protein AVDCRST_MAG62-1813 [uncultured Sphingomonas sp.]